MGNNVAERSKLRRFPPAIGPYPWLVYTYGKGDREQTFCSISHPNKTYPRRIPELKCIQCWASSHGWCVMSSRQNFFLWNPITLEKINLPNNPQYKHICNGILISPPNNPECMVILFAREQLFLKFWRLGDEQWTKLDYEEDLKRHIPESRERRNNGREDYLCHPVICNSNLYVLRHRPDKLVVIDEINQNEIIFRQLPLKRFPSLLHTMRGHRYLVEYNGEIFVINKCNAEMGDYNDIVAVAVYKLDFSLMDCHEVKSAKDLAFFVSFNNSFCCRAMKPETEGNRVYFTLAEGRNLYSYNIEDGTLSVLRPFSNLSALRDSPFWMLPDSLTNTKEQVELQMNMKQVGKRYVHVGKRERTSKAKPKKKDTEDKQQLSYLFSIAPLIVKCLVSVDYLHFRATCKKFRSIAPLTQWKTMLKSFSNHSLPTPWLMFFGKDFVCTFFDPFFGDKYFIELPAGVICYAKDGWLLMQQSHLSTYLFQPFTRQKLQLPQIDVPGWSPTCIGFSQTPTSPNCLLVAIDNHPVDQGIINLTFAHLEDNKWHFVPIQNESNFQFYHNSPVFYKGAFYYLGQNGNLGVLEFINNTPSWNVLPKPQRPCEYYHQNFLLECGGDLLSVFVGYFHKWVRVFQLNQSTMTWTKVKNLGNFMLYVSRSSSFSTVAQIPGMENKIYFPRFFRDNAVFYSLDTRKYYSFENRDLAIDFYDTREQLRCCWIEPKWG